MWKEFKRLGDLAVPEFWLSNKRKIQEGLGHETVEISTEWKPHRVVDSFKKKEVSSCIGLTVKVAAYLITPAGCVFSSALDWKFWECLCSGNLGWCCLYCSISAYVWNQCQQKTRIVFCFHTQAKKRNTAQKRNQPIAHHPVSALTPVPDSPSIFSLFASFALCPSCEIYGSVLKWINIQRSSRICKCFNRWNPCSAMDVSVKTCGLHEHHCMSVSVCSRILARVLRSPQDISVNTHISHIPPVACMWVARVHSMVTS